MDNATQNMSGKADLVKRIAAMLIDGIIAGGIGRIPYIGALIGSAYMLLRDGFELEFMDRRSLGKKLLKLRPIRLDGGKVDFETSIKRNWIFGLGLLSEFFLIIPIIGWLLTILTALASLVLFIMEVVLTFQDPEGRRWGDKLANTKVIEVND